MILCALPFVMSIRMLSHANTDFQIGIDFRMTYTAARAWLKGRDPYDDATLKQVWAGGGMPQATPPGLPQTPNVYPLSIAPVLAFLAWLPFPPAFAIWMLVNAAAAAWLVWAVIAAAADTDGPSTATIPDAARIEPADGQRDDILSRYWPHAAACLFLFGFPLHYGLLVGNLAITATLFVVLSLRYRDERPLAAGVFYGLALVKYTLCGPLAILFAVERRWRLLGTAAAVQLVLLGVASAGSSGDSAIGWVHSMLAAGFDSMAPGAVNHYASLDYTALHMELAALLFRIAPSLAAWHRAFEAALVAGLVATCGRRSDRPPSRAIIELRYVLVLALTMIGLYHRTYDAIVVIVPLIAWLLRHGAVLRRGLRGGLWMAAGLSVFAGPTVAGGGSHVPYVVLAFVQMNVVWAMLIVVVVGMAAIWSLGSPIATREG